MISPVHYSNNQFADSSTDGAGKTWNGLSPLGRDLVRDANRLGMILDASHASDDTLDQMIQFSRTPVILSHSASKWSFGHPRNVDDVRLKRLAASGGVVQIVMASDFLVDTPISPERQAALDAVETKFGPVSGLTTAQASARAEALRRIDADHPIPLATFDTFMRELRHVLDVVGVDHVGFGIDLDGGGGTIGFKDVADLPKITAALIEVGFSEQDLEKISSGNLLRVMKQVEDHARKEPR